MSIIVRYPDEGREETVSIKESDSLAEKARDEAVKAARHARHVLYEISYYKNGNIVERELYKREMGERNFMEGIEFEPGEEVFLGIVHKPEKK